MRKSICTYHDSMGRCHCLSFWRKALRMTSWILRFLKFEGCGVEKKSTETQDTKNTFSQAQTISIYVKFLAWSICMLIMRRWLISTSHYDSRYNLFYLIELGVHICIKICYWAWREWRFGREYSYGRSIFKSSTLTMIVILKKKRKKLIRFHYTLIPGMWIKGGDLLCLCKRKHNWDLD